MNVRYLALQVGACAAVAVAGFVLVYAAAAAPFAPVKRLGLRGLKRQRLLEKNETWRTVEPAVRWMGQRVSGLVSDEARASLNHKIGVAGDWMGFTPEEFVAFSIVTGLAGLIVGTFVGFLTDMGLLVSLPSAAFGAIAPLLSMGSAAQERFKLVNRRLPYAIDLLALAMGAGLDFPGAVRQVVEKGGSADDPLVEEFTLILQSLQLGRTRKMALEDFAARVPTDVVAEFVSAVVQAELRGNPVAQVLRIQAEVSRQRRSVRAEESAAKAGVAMVGPLLLVFVAILLLIVGPMALNISKSGM